MWKSPEAISVNDLDSVFECFKEAFGLPHSIYWVPDVYQPVMTDRANTVPCFPDLSLVKIKGGQTHFLCSSPFHPMAELTSFYKEKGGQVSCLHLLTSQCVEAVWFLAACW